MSPEKLASKVIDKMFEHDSYSQWMKMERISEGPGYCTLRMKIRPDMLNGFGIAHGSITFALADSALAFASNSYGYHCVSIDTQISHLHPCVEGDVITASATELNRSRSLGRYDIQVTNQEEKLVAHFRGTVFIKDKPWFPLN